MKIALIGATGFVGGFILNEALSRGHAVTALSRHPDKLAANPKLRACKEITFTLLSAFSFS
jgi:hypothetical protein